jgi:NAD-dependent SIR2 family protein deacetylase
MKDNAPKEQLLKLIEELKLPIVPEEAKENLEKLSEEEIKELLSMYMEVRDYQDEVDSLARDIDPQKYAEIQENYYQKLSKLDEDYSNKMEEVRSGEDKKLDKAEEEASQEIDNLSSKSESEADELINAHSELYSKLDSSLDED